MKLLFVHYPKCGTCRKAANWLSINEIEVEKNTLLRMHLHTKSCKSGMKDLVTPSRNSLIRVVDCIERWV